MCKNLHTKITCIKFAQLKNKNTMKNVTATVNTKSNFNNLNGKTVKIIQFLGNIAFCEYEYEGTTRRCDFNIFGELSNIRSSND